jgi:hypothetical protein
MGARRTIYAECDESVVLIPLEAWHARHRIRVLARARPRLRWVVERALRGLRLAPYEPGAAVRESLRYLDPDSEGARVMASAVRGSNDE